MSYYRMINTGKNVNLSFEISDLVRLINPFLIIDLYCHLLSISLINPHSNCSISSLSQFTIDFIIPQLKFIFYFNITI